MENQLNTNPLSRRQVLQKLTAVLGSVSINSFLPGLSAAEIIARGHAVHERLGSKSLEGKGELLFLNPHQAETVAIISDLIIPRTKTAGARDVNVHLFIDLLLSTGPIRDQKKFLGGLAWIDTRSLVLFQRVFAQSRSEQQTELLSLLSREDSQEEPEGIEFLGYVKSLTVFGYYTSKEGLEQELGYQAMGYGVYKGCSHPEHEAGGAEEAKRLG